MCKFFNFFLVFKILPFKGNKFKQFCVDIIVTVQVS